MASRILPVPTDPNFMVPDIDEAAFLNPPGEEDADLLATGAWDDAPDDDDVGDDDDDGPVDTAPPAP